MTRSDEGVAVEKRIYDYVIIGSGFGGSVSAMRLTEKGYDVLVLERGKRFRDRDYPRTNWNIWKYLWLPALRCFGIQQLSLFQGFFVFGGCGVGGGSLVYAAVLMEPEESFFEANTWRHLAKWKMVLRPHYDEAKRMLGVTINPKLWPADDALKEVAEDLGYADTFRSTEVGYFFGKPGVEVPDPYFDGDGPTRAGCVHCGGCMVGCRYNAKNSLNKNYLYFAEKQGAVVYPETEVLEIQPMPDDHQEDARYQVLFRSATSWINKSIRTVYARNVIVSAGVLGTLKLLLNCRDVYRSLPNLSPQLGKVVRTNSEAFLGAFTLSEQEDHSKGLAITSIVKVDDRTQVEPVRFSDGSSMLFWIIGMPIIQAGGGLLKRLLEAFLTSIKQFKEVISFKFKPGLTRRGLALMFMQTEDNLMRLRLGRGLFTAFRRGLIADHDVEKTIPVNLALGNTVTKMFAEKIGGRAVGSILSNLLNLPTTAHMLGGCIFGENASEGVIDLNCEVFNYPGLYVIDGSIVPANPGVNPSLTITALAEYAMCNISPKEGSAQSPTTSSATAPKVIG